MEKFLIQILDELKNLNQRVGNLEQGQSRMETKVGNLEQGQSRMEAKVGNLEQSQSRMEAKVDSLEQGQQEIKADVTDLKGDVTTLKSDVAGLKGDVTLLNEGQLRLEARLENEVVNKVRALFDARGIQSDINQQILHALSRMEAKIDVLQLETAHIRRVR